MVIAGVALTVVGLLVWSGFGRDWLGRLPGDIHYAKGSFSFHFPLATCVVVSVVMTLILWLLRK